MTIDVDMHCDVCHRYFDNGDVVWKFTGDVKNINLYTVDFRPVVSLVLFTHKKCRGDLH